MAGQPITRKQLALLNGLTDEQEAEAFEYLATEGTVKKLAQRLGVGFRALYAWKDATPERAEAWANALRYRADILADEGLEIVDNAAETTEGVGKARIRSDYRKWLASVSNPEKYREKPLGAGVVLNIGTLHLEAVRASASMPRPERISGESTTTESLSVEILSAEETPHTRGNE